MLENEAVWIGDAIERHSVNTQNAPTKPRLLNIGSSNAYFRRHTQPHIHSHVVKRSEELGLEVINIDIKDDYGVDVVADISTEQGSKIISDLRPTMLICSNLLEHLSEPQIFAERLASSVPCGAILIVTVPYSYPYHADPIDNHLRPSPSELCSFFAGFKLMESAVVEGPTFLHEIVAHPIILPRKIIRTILPLPNFKAWLSALHRWQWLLKPYSASCVILQKVQYEQP